MGNLDYLGLAALDAVAACGSFDDAALTLGISRAAVAQRVMALEDGAGRLLLVRGAPAVTTGLGQRLVTHYRHVRLMEAALDIDLGRTASLPALTLAVDGDSLAGWFAQALPALLAPPRCRLDVRLADSAAALALVREGEAFGCVAAADSAAADGTTTQGAAAPGAAAHRPADRAADGTADGTASHPLGVQRYLCVATPAFAGRWFGDGFGREAVALAPAVGGSEALLAAFLARQLGAAAHFPQHRLALASARHGCMLAGVAYGLMPEAQAAAAIAAGYLTDLTPGASQEQALAWHAWQIDTPFTRALSEHVIATAARTLRQP